MKTWILAVVMAAGMTMQAQDGKMIKEQLKPEQRTELQVKELTLSLDLNDKQQKDVQKLLLDKHTKADQMHAKRKADRAAGKTPTADEKFAMKSKMLDEQIAHKSAMKKILTAEQFTKWEAMKKEPHRASVKRGGKFKKH